MVGNARKMTACEAETRAPESSSIVDDSTTLSHAFLVDDYLGKRILPSTGSTPVVSVSNTSYLAFTSGMPISTTNTFLAG